MKSTRRSGTDAEERVAEALRRRGIPFESNVKVLQDKRFTADIVLRDYRIAVFVDGCFWHGCPIHGTRAKANREFWDQKIAANQERDQRAVRTLESNGWHALRVWAHEDPDEVADRVCAMKQLSGHDQDDHSLGL